MADRRPIVRVDGENRQLPVGDKIPWYAIGPAMPYLEDPITAADLRDAMVVAGIMAPPAASVPINTSPPVVTGAQYVGDTATGSNGTWTGSPTGYEYRWQIDPGTGWEDVPGETTNAYADIQLGEYRFGVRAENAEGWSAWAYSSAFVITEAGGFQLFDSVTPNGAISGSDRVVTRTSGGDYVHASLSGFLHEDCYFELELSGTSSGGISLAADSEPFGDLDTYAVIGQLWEMPGITCYGAGWTAPYYAYTGLPEQASGDYLSFGSEQVAPQYLGIAYRHATRSFWARVRSGGVTSPWSLGGNPVTNATPLFVFPGSEPIRAGVSLDSASGRLLHPDDFTMTPPAGFALGVRA